MRSVTWASAGELGASEVLRVGWRAPALDAVGAAGSGGGGATGPAGGALAMTVQRDERDARAPRTRFMITDILDAPPRDLSAHRDSDSDRSATDSPGYFYLHLKFIREIISIYHSDFNLCSTKPVAIFFVSINRINM